MRHEEIYGNSGYQSAAGQTAGSGTGVPDVIRTPDEIGPRSPEEHGDVSLGLFLYDIQECEELQQRGCSIPI